MSADENREAARRFVELILVREDPAAVDELIGSPELAEALLAGFAEPHLDRPFTDDSAEFDEIVADDETAVVVMRATNLHSGPWPTLRFGTIPATGSRVTVPLILVMKFSEGKIVQFRDYPDLYGLLEQVGALPPAVEHVNGVTYQAVTPEAVAQLR